MSARFCVYDFVFMMLHRLTGVKWFLLGLSRRQIKKLIYYYLSRRTTFKVEATTSYRVPICFN